MNCNNCGGTLEIKSAIYEEINGKDAPLDLYGLVSASVSGNYESIHLSDCTTYSFSLCELCLRTMFDSFKIKPTCKLYMIEPNKPVDYNEDKKMYDFSIWKQEGKDHIAYLNGLCNQFKNCPNKAIYSIYGHDDEFTEDSACEEHKEEFYLPIGYSLKPFVKNALKPFI